MANFSEKVCGATVTDDLTPNQIQRNINFPVRVQLKSCFIPYQLTLANATMQQHYKEVFPWEKKKQQNIFLF